MAERELPKVTLSRESIDFKQDCMDAVAKLLVTEGLDYAVEKALSRLESVGKIFGTVEASGEKTLAVVNEVVNQIKSYPVCPMDKEQEAFVKKITPGPASTKKEKVEKGEELLEKAAKHVEEVVSKAKPAAKKKETKRTVPAVWQEVEYIDEKGESRTFETPGEAMRALGVLSTGARDQVHALRRAGFEVTGNGEPVKGKGKFIIKATGKPIPDEYKLLLKPEEEKEKKEPAVKVILMAIKKEDPKTKKLVTIAYDVTVGEKVQGRISTEEGDKLLAAGKAELI